MKSLQLAVLGVTLVIALVQAANSNSFDLIVGCSQYNSVVQYHGAIKYFPTESMQNVRNTGYSKIFKIAILGPSDGHIRFGQSVFPTDSDGIEIVLGGWGNTKSAGRRQRRTGSRNSNVQLAEAQTPNLMSPYRPVMFELEVFNNGRVEVRRYGQSLPFLTFNDNNRTPVNYMAFAKWEKDLIFFYDCPSN